MNQLVDLVVQKTGISPEKAREAVEVIINFIKGKLPPALASQVDSLIAGDGKAEGFLKSKLGGLFGGSGQ